MDAVDTVTFDRIAKPKEDITLRNQIFVTLTRSCGWAHLSGVGEFDVFDEMQQYHGLPRGPSFTFNRPPKRQIVDE